MNYVIASSALRAEVSARGAELLRLTQRENGREILWRGDEAYWPEHAPVLFPMIGRCWEDRYLLNGKSYEMGLHGFCRQSTFACTRREDALVELTLTDTPETRAHYPFSFRFTVCYALEGDELRAAYRTENRGETIMYFAVGAHPGFALPLAEACPFERHFLQFSEQPEEIVIAPKCMRTEEIRPFPAENGKLPLRHALFDRSARVLQHAGRVFLGAEGSEHGLALQPENMPYLALWHTLQTNAPFLCLEPWSSLPGAYGAAEDLASRSDLISLAPGQTDERGWRLRVF